MVVLAVLAELLEHLVSGNHLLDEVSVDVRDQNQLVRCQMRQKLFRDVTCLGNPSTVLEELNEDEELVWSLQDDTQIERRPEVVLTIWREAEQQSDNSSLHVVRVAAEDELHRVGLQKCLQEQAGAFSATYGYE